MPAGECMFLFICHGEDHVTEWGLEPQSEDAFAKREHRHFFEGIFQCLQMASGLNVQCIYSDWRL